MEALAPDRTNSWAFGGCFPSVTFGGSSGEAVGFPVWLSRAIPAVIDPAQDAAFALSFHIDTPYELLERFERVRAGKGDVVVRLSLHVQLFPVLPPLNGHPVLGVPRDFYENHVLSPNLNLSADQWRELLSKLRFVDVLIAEFPLLQFGRPPSARLVAARQELDVARKAYHDHRYDDAAVHSRKALDALVENGRAALADRIVDGYFGRAHDEVRTRARAAINGILRVFQLGPHAVGDDAFPTVPVTRQLAAFVFGTAQLIVGWCGDGAV